MANSIHFNSVDLSGSSYGFTLAAGSRPWMPDPRVDVRGPAEGFKGSARFGGFDPLEIALEGYVIGSSRSDFLSKMDALVSVLDPTAGLKTLRLDERSDRYWKAMLVRPLRLLEQKGLAAGRVQLIFEAPDPRAWSTTARTTPDFSITTDPQTMTVESGPTAVVGTAPAECVWILKNTSGGDVTAFELENTTRSESVAWAGTLANGHWVKIDTELGTMLKSTDSGSTWPTNMLDGVSGAFDLPKLTGGVVNSVDLSGCSAATVVLQYTARYL